MAYVALNREYERESRGCASIDPFDTWLRARCARMPDTEGNELWEVKALSCAPSRKVCSFRSMTSYGSHYRVEADELGTRHVTFDCGVAELRGGEDGINCSGQGGVVDLVRVGLLKDIWVLNYVEMTVVLMVVSWVAKDTERAPRLKRDPYGFWLANLAARPRCTEQPYILPVLASQVPIAWRATCFLCRFHDSVHHISHLADI